MTIYRPRRLTTPPVSTPGIGGQSGKDYDAIVHAHYFGPGMIDMYITEYDRETGECFGWSEVTPGRGQLGYTSLPELDEIPAIEFDRYWSSCTLRQAIIRRARQLGITPDFPKDDQ